MATTSPDTLWSPDPTGNYNLVADLATMQTSNQAALVKRANTYVGTSTQRTAFTTAPEGVHWQDTDGTKHEYVRQAGAWISLALEDTGWVNCTLASGVSQQGTTLPRVRRIGEVVYMRWGVSGSGFSANSVKTAFVIPNGFRPVSSMYVPIGANSAATAGVSEIAGSGEVSVRSGAAVGNYYMWDGISFLRGA